MTEEPTSSNSDGDEITPSSASDSPQPADDIGISSSPKDRAIRPLGLDLAKKLAAAAARVAIDNNGQDVAVLDVSAQSAEFDFFVFASGTSRRQLHAISEQIDDVLEKDLGDKRMGIE